MSEGLDDDAKEELIYCGAYTLLCMFESLIGSELYDLRNLREVRAKYQRERELPPAMYKYRYTWSVAMSYNVIWTALRRVCLKATNSKALVFKMPIPMSSSSEAEPFLS